MLGSLKAGVIGVGAMGRNHARIYADLPEVKLIGVADLNEKQARSVAKIYNCQYYKDYQELLEEQLDIVSIAVPTVLHFEIAQQAMQKKVNVLIEKPVASNLEQANLLIKTAVENKVKAMVGHIERFNPAVEKLKELIEKGVLGEIISISAKRVGPQNTRIMDVGIILDLATHDIDVMCYLYSAQVKSVYVVAGSTFHNHEDHAVITLRFNNGSSGIIETNWLTPHKMRKLTAIGSKGIAELDYQEVSLKLYDWEWTKEAKIEKEEPLKCELEHFVSCVKHNIEPKVGLKEGKHALEVALAAIQSANLAKICEIDNES
jgi:UDP-N-acetylglucosamine 3-dehydrogenase